MTRALILSIAICLFLGPSHASGEDVQEHLNATYKDKLYILRHPITKASQHYDGAGELIGSADEGPWTLYGALEIRKVTLSANQLRLTANRLVYTYDKKKNDLVPKKTRWDKQKVDLDVALSHPLASADEADSILHRIFAFNESELIEIVPDYWRPFLQKHTSTTPPASATDLAKASRPEPTAKIGAGVTPPKPLYTPEPAFNDVARDLGAEGLVVLTVIIDENGAVVRPEIVRPAGIGLDEQAVTKVRTWKFRPAMRDGKPVSVEMALEVAFNLT